LRQITYLVWSIIARLNDALGKRVERALVNAALRAAGLPHADRIPSYVNRAELVALYHQARLCPKGAIALEIGSYLGASACYIAAGLATHGGTLFCVDTWENDAMSEGRRDTFDAFKRNIEGASHLIRPVRKRSEDLEVTDIAVPLSLVFIDGDHSYDAVKRDFEKVEPWLARNGVLVFHDFGRSKPGVTRFVAEVLETGRYRIGGCVGSLIWLRPAEQACADHQAQESSGTQRGV